MRRQKPDSVLVFFLQSHFRLEGATHASPPVLKLLCMAGSLHCFFLLWTSSSSTKSTLGRGAPHRASFPMHCAALNLSISGLDTLQEKAMHVFLPHDKGENLLLQSDLSSFLSANKVPNSKESYRKLLSIGEAVHLSCRQIFLHICCIIPV